MSKYDEQRRKGAAQLLDQLKVLAQEAGVELVLCEWDGGELIDGREKHELVAGTKSSHARAEFSDEQLADYPGKAGTGAAEAMLRELVRSLT